MEDYDDLQTPGLQTKWMENTYENLKNIENLLMIAKRSPDPEERFDATKSIVTQMELGLSDSCAYIGEDVYKKFQVKLDRIKISLDNEKKKHLFITIKYSASTNKKIGTSTTPLLYKTIEYLANLRTELIIQLKEILYIKFTPPFEND